MRFPQAQMYLKRIPPQFIDSLLAAITDAVVKGDSVQFTGFGTFESRKRPARTGHNPATGATIDIPASTVPAFKAGKAFKDALKK